MGAYAIVKAAHVTCVAVSISLFVVRYRILSAGAGGPMPKWLKIVPHFNDALLLSAGVIMLVMLGLNPLAVPWLSVKLLIILLYIGIGAVCLNSAPGSRRQRTFFWLALLTFCSIAVLAFRKQLALF